MFPYFASSSDVLNVLGRIEKTVNTPVLNISLDASYNKRPDKPVLSCGFINTYIQAGGITEHGVPSYLQLLSQDFHASGEERVSLMYAFVSSIVPASRTLCALQSN
jgi:hypothetical protein